MYWILGIGIAIVFLFYFSIIKPAIKQIDSDINKHREYTEKNKLDVSMLIPTGRYIAGFPQAIKVIDKSSIYTNKGDLVLYSTVYDNIALNVSSIKLKKIQNLYIEDFNSMNDRIVKDNIILNESYFVSLSELEQNLPYYLVIEWKDSELLNYVIFIFEGKDALLLSNRAVHEVSELIDIDFICGF